MKSDDAFTKDIQRAVNNFVASATDKDVKDLLCRAMSSLYNKVTPRHVFDRGTANSKKIDDRILQCIRNRSEGAHINYELLTSAILDLCPGYKGQKNIRPFFKYCNYSTQRLRRKGLIRYCAKMAWLPVV